jgi:uncharacterized protein (TIGR03435 family)
MLCAALALLAQAMPDRTGAARPAFEVASVKPARSDGPIDLRVTPGGRLTVTNLTVAVLIREAYGVKHYQVSGGPAWLSADGFDINAKAEGEPSRPQMMLMLQTLLEDRFKLKVHRETREGNVYFLAATKNGPKLKAPTGGDASFIRTGRTGAPSQAAITYVLWGQNVAMPAFTAQLSNQMGRPVIDRTSIQSIFDFRLEYAADDARSDGNPSVFSAIQEQLGLKLEAGKGPVETFVIDSAQKPTLEN